MTRGLERSVVRDNVRAIDDATESGLRGDRATAGSCRTRVATILAALPGLMAAMLALIGPWIAPYPLGKTVARPFSKPTGEHILGTDSLGRDVWSQLLHGGRPIVLIPLIAVICTVATAGLLGVISGYFRGMVDTALSRVMDILIALPAILVLLVLVNGWGSSSVVLIVAVVATIGPYTMRYARSVTIQIAGNGFVEQATAIGERRMGVVVRELVPNVAGPLLADGALRMVGSIYLIASASFLGFGPKPPATDWARMVNEDLPGASLNAWSVAAPAIVIAFYAISVMVLADRAARRWVR